jgi:group I intron endonuclease
MTLEDKNDDHLISGRIYLITNLINNKCYVGQTSMTLLTRWKQHIYTSKRNICNMPISRAFNKYGIENFIIEQLEILFAHTMYDLSDKLNKREVFFIYLLQTYEKGYNATKGGGGRLGFILSENTKEKIRQTKVGKLNPMYGTKWSESKRKQMIERMTGENNHNYGKPLAADVKAKLSTKLLGRIIPESIKKQISYTMKGVPKSAQTRENMRIARLRRNKKIKQIDLTPQMNVSKKKTCIIEQTNNGRNKNINKGKQEQKITNKEIDIYDKKTQINLKRQTTYFINKSAYEKEMDRRKKISDHLKEYYHNNPRIFTPRIRHDKKIDLIDKVCRGPCGEIKAITNFYKKNDTADGFQPWCKNCITIAKSKYRKKLKEEYTTFQCEHCEKSYKLVDSLKRHIKEKHPPCDPRSACQNI